MGIFQSDSGRCDSEVFEKGDPVAALDARSKAAEQWVRAFAEAANARVDWHYSGGVAQVLHLGDAESRARVEAAIDKLQHTLDGTILNRYPASATGLYRAGVSTIPTNAIAAYYDGGDSAFIFGE